MSTAGLKTKKLTIKKLKNCSHGKYLKIIMMKVALHQFKMIEDRIKFINSNFNYFKKFILKKLQIIL